MSSAFQQEPPPITQFLRCAFYGRFSTKMQRPASITTQLLICREFVERKGWALLEEHIYKDEGRSGTKRLNRIGLQDLERAAEKDPCPFDCLLFDDTSRLGRDQADVLNFTKLMTHYRIKVCFVSQQMDSSDENFPILLNSFSLVDQLYVGRQRLKVFSSQKERVMAGFHVGSVPYGYRSVTIANTSDPAAIGRAATLGSKLEAIEEQAAIVCRIFQLFVDGHAMWSISRRLNVEKIPSPQNIRAGRMKSEWSHYAIRHILRNPKYRGENVWNLSHQTQHPQTGRIKKEMKPAHMHVHVEADYLRMVDDELWFKAAEILKKKQDKQAARMLGGYSRAKAGLYLFSGLLYCGTCGSRMKIGGVQGKGVYECPNHRQSRGCTNAIRIREEGLTKQLVTALADQMFDPEYLNILSDEVYEELQTAWRKQVDQVSKEQIPQLLTEKAECQTKIDNLIDAIENGGHAGLNARLEARHLELSRIEAKLKAAQGTAKLTTTKEAVRSLVYQSLENLVGVLKEDVALARTVLHKHIKKLLLYADDTADGRKIFVIGEVDLFCNSSQEKGGVLLGCEGILTPQQHTDHYYRFAVPIYLNVEECHLAKPLHQLLLDQPELSLLPQTPGVWATLLRDALGEEWDSKRPLGSGAVGRCFGRHRHILEQRLNIIKSKHTTTNGWHYQISIQPDGNVVGEELSSIEAA